VCVCGQTVSVGHSLVIRCLVALEAAESLPAMNTAVRNTGLYLLGVLS
jgi:hypothetical protein